MLDIEGTVLTDSERLLLQNPQVGGLILFARNFEDPGQLQSLIQDVRGLNPALIIAVDQEGGRVQRFKHGFTRIPPMACLGRTYTQDRSVAISHAKDWAWLMATELRCYDIDISFAPVLDIDFGVSDVIGDRAFSKDPDACIELARAFVSGMTEAGMASTGKHFPGHGGVAADSHLELPKDQRSAQSIRDQDMEVFRSLIDAGLDALMPAHVIYTDVDPRHPAGFSEIWLKKILRQELGFKGIIFSDDLAMAGAEIAGSYAQRAEAALKAGCDMVLVCNDRDGALEVLDYLSMRKCDSNENLKRMRGQPLMQNLTSFRQSDRYLRVSKSMESAMQTGDIQA